MSTACPSMTGSVTEALALRLAGQTINRDRRSQATYALALGSAVAALVAAVDLPSVAILGTRVPWSFFPQLLILYVLSGVLVGSLVSCVWKRLYRAESIGVLSLPHATFLRHLTIPTLLALFAVVLFERLIGGNTAQANLASGIVALFVISLGILAGYFLWSRQQNATTPGRITLSQLAVLSASFIWWAPYNKLYTAPAFSAKSLLWNLIYLIGCVGAYRFVIFLSNRRVTKLALRSARSCGCVLCSFSLFGLTTSSALWAFRYPAPIDRPSSGESSVSVSTEPHSKTNVVLIVIDTARADHLSCYGYAKNTTPVLSAFAQESMVYAHAISPAPWTLPAHASLFTGLYPRQHGAFCHPREKTVCQVMPLPQKRETVAELLAAHGYDTAAILGNWSILHREFRLNQGFAYYDDRPRIMMNSAASNTLSPARWLTGLWQCILGPGYPSRGADEVNASAFAWLHRARTQPFLLFINYLDAHQPYQTHPAFVDQLAAPTVNRQLPTVLTLPQFLVPTELVDDVARYDQELAFVDAQIGHLFGRLRSAGLYDSSLIIVTSDHGEAFDEHGYTGHGNTVYEEEVHVPLIVRYPYAARRGVVTKTTSLVAVADLISEAVGLPLLHSATARAGDIRDVVLTERFRWLPPTSPQYAPTTTAVYLDDGTKVLTFETTKYTTKAYDLAVDPFEQIDVAHKRPEQLRWASTLTRAFFNDARLHQITDTNETQNAQLVNNLKTLGYIGE